MPTNLPAAEPTLPPRALIARYARLLIPLGIALSILWMGFLLYWAFRLAETAALPLVR